MRTSSLTDPGPARTGGLTGTALKGLAVLSMTIDHAAAVLLANGAACAGSAALSALYAACRSAGRLAFPIFCFLLTEGFVHTASRSAYALRLVVFAILSEPVFDLAFYSTFWYPGYQNVFFTLLLGLLALSALHAPQPALRWAGPLACLLAAELLHTDYGGYGVLLILIFSLFSKNRPAGLALSAAAILLHCARYGYWRGAFALFALVPILACRGARGRRLPRYAFYLYYPLHLLALCLVRAQLAAF